MFSEMALLNCSVCFSLIYFTCLMSFLFPPLLPPPIALAHFHTALVVNSFW